MSAARAFVRWDGCAPWPGCEKPEKYGDDECTLAELGAMIPDAEAVCVCVCMCVYD